MIYIFIWVVFGEEFLGIKVIVIMKWFIMYFFLDSLDSGFNFSFIFIFIVLGKDCKDDIYLIIM